MTDIIGIIGVLLIVLAYLLIQIDKLKSSNVWYSIMNLSGAVLLLVSLLYNWNTSAVLIEVFWIMISLYGLYKALTKKGTD